MTAVETRDAAAEAVVWLCRLLNAELAYDQADAAEARCELRRLGVSIRLRRSLTDERGRR